jgi:hypothetical protein
LLSLLEDALLVSVVIVETRSKTHKTSRPALDLETPRIYRGGKENHPYLSKFDMRQIIRLPLNSTEASYVDNQRQ